MCCESSDCTRITGFLSALRIRFERVFGLLCLLIHRPYMYSSSLLLACYRVADLFVLALSDAIVVLTLRRAGVTGRLLLSLSLVMCGPSETLLT